MNAVTIEQTPVFTYKTDFLLNALMDGAHKSRRQGPGSEFYRKASFLSEPNPSRVDLARSLVDPFETLYVKTFRQRSELDVITLADGSNSMLNGNKPTFTANTLDCISKSIVAESDKPHHFLLTEKVHQLTDYEPDWSELITELSEQPTVQSATAFNEVQGSLPWQRSLIFLVSDFHWPAAQLKSVLTALSAHYVVPVIVWANAETADYPLWRFVEVQDAESAELHLLFNTPRQQRLIRQTFIQRKQFLNTLFSAYGFRPLWLAEPFSVQQFNRYFLGE
ncbi:hypothetical protein Q7C_2120 [Methylophaga frappieri]|uniref:MxaS protein n=1 Tax=Methylophaga frappieri (strain ATCC BAA-2434 / DSM 25690 / JAM7) TaxID=754477 RepID=I1YK13_METFJ|nr:hypothetical protein [Methylophaga frappieri]AFJ03256.1 hypothetical protein Q7C_2120 [Methylophaga frappieri]